MRLIPTPRHLQDWRPARRPPQEFEYMVPRTSVWNESFTICAMKIINSLAIRTEFDFDRLNEFKSWCFQLFFLLEVEAWNTECIIKNYAPLTTVSSLPLPTLLFNLSAITFTNCVQLPFIKVLPSATFYPSVYPTHLISITFHHTFKHSSLFFTTLTHFSVMPSSKPIRATPSPCCALTTMPHKCLSLYFSFPPDRVLPQGGNKWR